ncbi:MAG: SlyX family protein [Pseudomonadota bacterium]
MSEDRLIDLETRLAFQEDTITTLDDVVTRQQQQIDDLVQQIAILKDRVERREGASEAATDIDERPPHY